MRKKSPLDATIEELDEIARKAFAEHAADLASGNNAVSSEDYEVLIPFSLLKKVMEHFNQNDASHPARDDNNDEPSKCATETDSSWDKFFDELEPVEDFLLDRDQ